MLSTVLSLTSNLTQISQKSHFSSNPIIRPFSKSQICFTFSPSNQNPIGEEARWLREEQRWLREEQRWLREESRWSAERQALLQEINSLKLKIQELELLNSHQSASSVSETVANIAKLLQVVKEGDIDLGKNVNRISESGSSAMPLVVEATKSDEEIVVKEVISIPDKKITVNRKATLRKGAEGDAVKAMQEALEKLGFYSGEDDMEYSCFESGTERAVKTWQSSLGVPEDGIVTAQLLEQLFGSSDSEVANYQEHKATDLEKSENGAPIAYASGKEDVYASENRVFLLGENRWEDPSRLSKSGQHGSYKSNAINKCITCRGEGRLLCMECDGTGEPNIEEQFMDFLDESAKCPYCEGLGYTTCDLCGGVATKV